MPKNPTSSGKKATKKNPTPKRTYLREIQIKYRKKRVKAGSAVGKKIAGAQQVFELFSDMQNETKEKMIVICLDVKLKILCFEVVAIGSLNTIYAKPFEVVRSAILVNADGLILVHNHPSGEVDPGLEDRAFTRDIKELCERGGVLLHDHVIIGDDGYYSFAESGLMARM